MKIQKLCHLSGQRAGPFPALGNRFFHEINTKYLITKLCQMDREFSRPTTQVQNWTSGRVFVQ